MKIFFIGFVLFGKGMRGHGFPIVTLLADTVLVQLELKGLVVSLFRFRPGTTSVRCT